MRTHKEIDTRSLALAQAIVERIDSDPTRTGIEKARIVCRRWREQQNAGAIAEWLEILDRPWAEIRSVLLDNTQRGQRLRQSSPFCGILSARERWEIYRKFSYEKT